jgi:hypothetical protein
MANYPEELALNAACLCHTGRLTGLWFLPKPAQGLNTYYYYYYTENNRTLFKPPTTQHTPICS